MTSRIDDYHRMKKLIASTKTRVDREKGRLDKCMEEIRGFECDSIAEAKEKLKGLRKRGKKEREAADKALGKFEKKWEEKLC